MSVKLSQVIRNIPQEVRVYFIIIIAIVFCVENNFAIALGLVIG